MFEISEYVINFLIVAMDNLRLALAREGQPLTEVKIQIDTCNMNRDSSRLFFKEVVS